MKSETEKQISATSKAFKPIEAYLQRRNKLAQAFEALAQKNEQVGQAHKSFLQHAGEMEARRLLGEASNDDAQKLDTGMLDIRDQQDRLAAAHHALSSQKAELDQQVKPLHEQAAKSLTQLKHAVEGELDQELRRAAAQVSAVVARLYAFHNATGMGIPGRQLMEIVIPSAVNGENLFQAPVRFHPVNHEVIHSHWERDAEAKALHERLKGFGAACNVLRRDEREIEEQERRKEASASLPHRSEDAA